MTKIKVHVDSIENGKISLSLLEDLEIPEESVDKGGSRKDSKRPDNRRRNDRPNNRNRNDKT